MALLRRRRRTAGAEPVPHWSPLKDPAEHAAFREAVDAAVAGLGLGRPRWGAGIVEVDVDRWHERFGVVTIAERCRELPREQWPAHVHETLAAMAQLVRDRRDPPSWEEARERIRVRLRRREEIPAGMTIVGEPYADDLVATVAYDTGDQVKTVHADEANAWGLTFHQLLEVAGENTRALDGVDRQDFTHRSGAEAVLLAAAGHVFGASQGIWPNRVVDVSGPFGALVAVPNRHVAFVHAVADARVRDVVDWVLPWVRARFDAGAGPISEDLYWWRPGGVVRLPVDWSGDAPRLRAPADFEALVDDLARQAGR